LKKDEENKLTDALNKKRNSKKKVTLESMDNEIKGKDYHIEANGRYTLYKKPQADRFPKQYIQPVKADIS
jgi:hypothetical protein